MPRVFTDIVGEGALFTRAYVSTSVCCPSRAEMFTGLDQHHTNVDSNLVPLTRPTIAMSLHDAGYRTMLAGKYLNSWTSCSPRPEFDEWSCVGSPPPSTYSQVDPWINVDGTLTHFTGYQADILAHQVSDFVASTPAAQPFFAIYAPTTPHSPADDPRYDSMKVTVPRPPAWNMETRTTSLPEFARRGPLSAGLIASTDRHFVNAARSVRGLDDSVGVLLDGLGDRADDTLVIYLSDNGYEFGEHRRIGKDDAFEESVRVPMAVRYPPALPESDAFVSDRLVANIDVAPTIADVAGVAWAADGTSIMPLLRGDPGPIHHAVLLERCHGDHLVADPCTSFRFEGEAVYPPAFDGIVTQRYSYVEYSNGDRQLFDLSVDPYELTNLADDPGSATILERLATTLAAMRAPPPVDTTIVTGPSGDLHQRFAAFTFFSQSRFATYRCRLVRAGIADPWHDCSTGSDVVGGLPDGGYVFEVEGVDETGAIDRTPAARAFRVVTSSGPDVSVTTGPPATQKSRNVTFGFGSSTPGATFECRMAVWDRVGTWAPCDAAAGASYTGLQDGLWRFEVRAIDPVSGEHSAPPGGRLVRIDNLGPAFTFSKRPPRVTAAKSAKFAFAPLEATTGQLTCTLDGRPSVDCSAGSWRVTGLRPGTHAFSVAGRDLLGNARSGVVTWSVDRAAPAITLSGAPPALATTGSATFRFSSTEAPAYFACVLDAYPEMPCSGTWTEAGLGNGPHTLTAWALDRVLNRSAPVQWSWTVDTVSPVVTITGGPAQGSVTTATTATFTFTSTEPGTFRCSLDAGPFGRCTSATRYTRLLPGAHTFQVHARDLAGNLSTTKTRGWTISA
jgi:N-acetylglucosamine-6-sulfatase